MSATGGYVLIWLADIALCAFAALVSFLIQKGNDR